MTEATRGPEANQVDALWERFKSSADAGARERLILHYSPLVKYVAGRVGSGLPRSVDQNDLASYGLFGLIDAIDKFELERGFKFETYAINRIKGAILDELRALDWVPRSVRSRARLIETAVAELEHTLQRAPTDQELADNLEMDVADLQSALAEIGRSGIAALDEFVGNDSSTSVGDMLADPTGVSPETAFQAEEKANRALSPALLRVIAEFPRDAHPMDAIRTAVSFMGMEDPEWADIDDAAQRRKAMRLLAKIPTAVAAAHRASKGQAPIAPDPSLSFCENFFHMVFGKVPQPEVIKAFDVSMILYAEHTFNASTFTARTICSTMAATSL